MIGRNSDAAEDPEAATSDADGPADGADGADGGDGEAAADAAGEAAADAADEVVVSDEAERRASWLGGPEPPPALVEALPAGIVVRAADDARDWVNDLARVVLAVADAEALQGLTDGLPAGAAARSRVVAWGCADSGASDAALAAGAAAAVRADAGRAEARAVLEAVVERADLRETCRTHERDLRKQRALSLKDDLTAAYNRRYFDRALDEEIERARRLKSSVAVIFMDLDDLKSVNQRWGHAMGSAVLREAAARTIRSIRSIDKVVRYGGDEFCIILPGADAEGGREVAERVRAELARGAFVTEPTGGVTLTASFGIAAYPEHGDDRASLIAAADKAMFRIKDALKNGILVAGEEIP